MSQIKTIKSALVSVYYKDNLEPIIKKLNSLGVKLYSTGGTLSFIEKLNIPVTAVDSVTTYPEIFGGAACISTHWPGTFSSQNNPIPDAFINYMDTHLPNPKTHTIYFDYGNKTLDALYPDLQKKVDVVMTQKGFTTTNWTTQFFEGKDHSEKSWSERLHIPLQFLLQK